jgi:hypothetical protein
MRPRTCRFGGKLRHRALRQQGIEPRCTGRGGVKEANVTMTNAGSHQKPYQLGSHGWEVQSRTASFEVSQSADERDALKIPAQCCTMTGLVF